MTHKDKTDSFKKTLLININGKISSGKRATLDPLDRSYFFGDSIYETFLAVDGKLLFAEPHWQRLRQSADFLRFKNMDLNFIKSQVKRTLARFRKTFTEFSASELIVRLVVSRGSGPLNINPNDRFDQTFTVFVFPFSGIPKKWKTQGMSIKLAKTRRNDLQCLDPRAKTGNYLNNIFGLLEIENKSEYDDVLFLNLRNEITELSTASFFWITDGVVYTSTIQTGILESITRSNTLKLCRELQIPAKEVRAPFSVLEKADACFLASSTKHLVPITKVNNFSYSTFTNQTFLNLTKAYQRLISDSLNS